MEKEIKGKALKAPAVLRVKLAHCYNPDYDDMGGYRVACKRDRNTFVTVGSLFEASRACSEFIEKNQLGGGNWDGGEVFNSANKQVARISYNGRVWTV